MEHLGGNCYNIYCLYAPIYTLVSYLRFRDSVTLGPLIPTFDAHRGSSPKTTLTIPQPSEGSHYALDRNQPPTQANISIAMAETYQNNEAIIYSQPFPRVPRRRISRTVNILRQQERQRHQSHIRQISYP
jgi:hypothetical protein